MKRRMENVKFRLVATLFMPVLLIFVPFLMQTKVYAKTDPLEVVQTDDGTDVTSGVLDLIAQGDFPSDGKVRNQVTAWSTFGATERDSAAKEVYEAMLDCETSINMEKYGIRVDEIKTFLENVVNEHPNLFHIGKSFSYITQTGNAGLVGTVYISYIYQKSEVVAYQQKMSRVIGNMLEDLDLAASDLEKALHVHDALALYCEYDKDYVAYGNNKDKVSLSSFSMKGALVDGVAVCQGYAMAYQYILETYLGMDCTLVSSQGMDHIWNLVGVGGSRYHVDVTGDDPLYDALGYAAHEYFLLSEAGIMAKGYYGFRQTGLANDRRFDEEEWKGVTSAILKAGGNRYFIDGNGVLSRFYVNENGGGHTVHTEAVRNVWDSSNLNWKQCKLAVKGDELYFNTKKGIYAMKADGSGYARLYDWTGLGDVYGLAFKNGALSFTVKTDVKQAGVNHVLDVTKEVNRTKYFVTFDSRNGTDSLKVIAVEAGKTTTLPQEPVKAGYTFQGWFTDVDGKGDSFTERTPVTSDWMVYAKWGEAGDRTVSDFTVKKKAITVTLGKSYKLSGLLSPKNASVRYQSSDKKVAKVNAKGKVTAKGIGTCTVTITSKANAKDKAKIKITVIPKKPAGVKGKARNKKAVLSWRKQKGVTGWEVHRSLKKSSGYKRIASVGGPGRTTFTDAKVKRGKAYYYKLRAYKTVKGKRICGKFCVVKRVLVK